MRRGYELASPKGVMRLIATKPDAQFAVWELHDSQAATPPSTLLPLLYGLTGRLARDPGKMLRSLADLACELCGADAAGICIERGEPAQPSPTVPIVIAAGTCTSMSGAEVPRAQSGCAIAIQQRRPMLFCVPAGWLPVPAAQGALAYGITAPWSAGQTHGTLWMLAHRNDKNFRPEEHATLVTLASLVGIAVSSLLEQDDWRTALYRSAADSFTNALTLHVQQPLEAIRADLQRALGLGSEHSRTRHLRRAANGLARLSTHVAELLEVQEQEAA